MSQLVKDLKAKYKTLTAAKEALGIKARGWDELASKVDPQPIDASSPKQISLPVKNEIARLTELHDIDPSVLEAFALFVLNPPPQLQPLSLAELKDAIYKYFSVNNTADLRKSGSFKMATNGMDKPNLGVKDGWEKLYRKFVDILPNETNQEGYGCINGVNIFNYFRPWEVFGIKDPKAAEKKDIKEAYNALAKIYHPDAGATSDVAIFDRLTIMYKSITAEA